MNREFSRKHVHQVAGNLPIAMQRNLTLGDINDIITDLANDLIELDEVDDQLELACRVNEAARL